MTNAPRSDCNSFAARSVGPDLVYLVSCDEISPGCRSFPIDVTSQLPYRWQALIFCSGRGNVARIHVALLFLLGRCLAIAVATLFYKLGLDSDSGQTLSCVQFEAWGVSRRKTASACARRPCLARP